MVRLATSSFWIGSNGEIFEGRTHADLIKKLIKHPDADPFEENDDNAEDFANHLIEKGWIRGFSSAVAYGHGHSIGIMSNLSALSKHEHLIEDILRTNHIHTVYLEVVEPNGNSHSFAIDVDDIESGFFSEILHELRISKIPHRRPTAGNRTVRSYWRKKC